MGSVSGTVDATGPGNRCVLICASSLLHGRGEGPTCSVSPLYPYGLVPRNCRAMHRTSSVLGKRDPMCTNSVHVTVMYLW